VKGKSLDSSVSAEFLSKKAVMHTVESPAFSIYRALLDESCGDTRVGTALYGTAAGGGANDDGTVFSLTPQGGYTVVYSFLGSPDGNLPVSALTNLHSTLHGTTQEGGANGYGTIYSVTPQRVETVLYSFKGGTDAILPAYGLTEMDGTLYGTTYEGGAYRNGVYRDANWR
jgi:uncharacterized repeat protein (TIGR03803 family)